MRASLATTPSPSRTATTLPYTSHGYRWFFHHSPRNLQLPQGASGLLFQRLRWSLYQLDNSVPHSGETTDRSLAQDQRHVGDIARLNHLHQETGGWTVWGGFRRSLEWNDVRCGEDTQIGHHAARVFSSRGNHHEKASPPKTSSAVCSLHAGRAASYHHRANAAGAACWSICRGRDACCNCIPS